MWLTPPERKIQMMLWAFGGKCGRPSGSAPDRVSSPRTIPSRCNTAPSAMPVKPRPTSARKARRWMRPQGGPGRGRRGLRVMVDRSQRRAGWSVGVGQSLRHWELLGARRPEPALRDRGDVDPKAEPTAEAEAPVGDEDGPIEIGSGVAEHEDGEVDDVVDRAESPDRDRRPELVG